MRIASKYTSVPPVMDNRSFLLTPRPLRSRLAIYCVSFPKKNSQTPTLNLLFPPAHIDAQSKQCQKLHWRGHKAFCSNNAAVTQKIRESPEGKFRAREMRLWMNAWTPAISYCLPLALDLANHEWGRHDTHAYVPSSMGSKFAFSDSIPTRSLVMFMEDTGLDGDHQSHRVGEFRIARHVCMRTNLYHRLILL